MSAARRTVDTSVAQPFPDDDFDQSAPDFEAAETASDFQRLAQTPAGFVDRDLDLQLVPAGRDFYGTPLHLQADGTHAQRVSAGIVSAVSMRREPTRGGVCIVARLGEFVLLQSGPLSDGMAEAREANYREAAHKLAPHFAPLVGTGAMHTVRVGRVSAELATADETAAAERASDASEGRS